MKPVLLSQCGSDRATAYSLSNKIVRHEGRILATWLDAASDPGGRTKIQLAIANGNTGIIENIVSLGEAVDNHCGAVLAMDHEDRLHMIIGAHGGSFFHRYSAPGDFSSWSAPVEIPGENTYPTLACDPEGTLHLVYREYGERWALQYRRCRTGEGWGTPWTIALSPTEGYNNFMQSLSVGPDGTLHLFFQFHFTTNGNSADCETRMAAYLRSRDGGDTWTNEGQLCQLPLTLESTRSFISFPGGKWRLANHVVDSQGQPWVFVSLPEEPSAGLFRRAEGGWQRVDVGLEFSKLSFCGPMGREVSLSRSRDGTIHLVAATRPDGVVSSWYDPQHELFHLRLNEQGQILSMVRLTQPNPDGAQWLPAVENWDWVRADDAFVDAPWLLYTCGQNRGGIGGDNANTLQTEVYLRPLRAEA